VQFEVTKDGSVVNLFSAGPMVPAGAKAARFGQRQLSRLWAFFFGMVGLRPTDHIGGAEAGALLAALSRDTLIAA
jgi:hypothetical protein